MRLSLFVFEHRDLERSLAAVRDAEARGFAGVWFPELFGFDALTALALAGRETQRILLGTMVVPTWPRHPLVMAQQGLTAQAASGGRFRLGVGTSDVDWMEDGLGIPFARPVRHMREYLTVVQAALRGPVDVAGELYRVRFGLDLPPLAPPPVYVSALGEQLCRVAGQLADGVITWLAPHTYLAGTVAPVARTAAARAGRPAPALAAAVPCTLSADAPAVRAAVQRQFGSYVTHPFYRAMLVRAGLPADAPGWTDALVDATVVYGDAAGFAARIGAFAAAGVDELVLYPFSVEEGDDAALAATLEALARLV